MSDFNVSIVMTLKERILKPLKGITGRLRELKKEAKAVTAGLRQTTSELGRFSAKILASAGAVTFGIKKLFVDPAAEMERYQSVLKNLEGSNEKAAKSMKWIEEFTSKTPFQVAQVTDAFVKMRSFGLDPTSGLLETLGNTSAAMGKDIDQAVEAIADAVTGENERLKEFGIKAKTEGGTVVYEFTDKGLTRQIEVAKDDRQAIQDALAGIWDQKFAGAMSDQMDTFNGKMSNLSDSWHNFRVRVMNNGVMDYLKEKLDALAVSFSAWTSDPALIKRIANDMIAFLKGLWSAAVGIKNFIQTLADFVGGWRRLGFAALFTGLLVAVAPALVALGGLTLAVYKLGKAAFKSMVKVNTAAALSGAGAGKGGLLGKLKGAKGAKGLGAVTTLISAASIGSTLLDSNLTGTERAKALTEDVGGLAGALGGAKAGAISGAALGSFIPVIGNIAGGIAGSIIGGGLGYWAGSSVGKSVGGLFGDDKPKASGHGPLMAAGTGSKIDATYAPVFNLNGSSLTRFDVEEMNRRMMAEHQRSVQAKARGVLHDG
jgi:phage tail tape-measure protein